MVLYSDLRNWVNGNISDIDRDGLISIAHYYEHIQTDSDIEYDVETDAEYTGVDKDD